MLALVRDGYTVLVPAFSDSERYDFVLDVGGRFLRVQVKTGRITANGCVSFQPRSVRHAGGIRDYRGDVDLFAVYCPANGVTYWVRPDDVGRQRCELRLRPTANGQVLGVRVAADYARRPFAAAP